MKADGIDWSRIDHLYPHDFDDPTVPGSWRHMNPDSILWLADLRSRTGWPILTHNRFGIRGCVCVDSTGHGAKSRHYVNHPDGCSAIDFHFLCDAGPRAQAKAVLETPFTGIGIYYDWRWNGKPLPVGFHVDIRPTPQVWKSDGNGYVYFLK